MIFEDKFEPKFMSEKGLAIEEGSIQTLASGRLAKTGQLTLLFAKDVS